MKFTLAAVTLASLVSLGAASPIEKRAGPPGGPSGSLVYPPGGTTVSNVGQKGHIAVKYNQVSNGKVDYYIGQTEGIDITLEPMNGNTRPAVKVSPDSLVRSPCPRAAGGWPGRLALSFRTPRADKCMLQLTKGLASLGGENQSVYVAPIEANLFLGDACGDYRDFASSSIEGAR